MQRVDKQQQDTDVITIAPEPQTKAIAMPFAVPTAESGTVAEEIETRAIDTLETEPGSKTPEKVSGLEKLAANKFKVPKYRKYFSAEQCAKGLTPELRKELRKELVKILAEQHQELIVRSAHPQESEFSGGTFESITIKLWKIENGKQKTLSPEELSEAIMTARRKIVEMAKPENSLQVRRDLRHKGIKDFDPDKMGIYINDLVSSRLQLTIVPLDDNTLSIRFNQGNTDGQNIYTFEIPKTGTIPTELLIKITEKTQSKFFATPIGKIQLLIKEIQRAQSLFEEPQEMEIHLCHDDEHAFVQTKTVTPETTTSDEIDENLFQSGVQKFGGSEKASKRSEVRETTSLVIDEWKWMQELGITLPKLPQPIVSKELTHTLIRNRLRDNISSQTLAGKLEERYAELMQLAEANAQYTLTINHMVLSEQDSAGQPWAKKILEMREQLIDSASVQIRGISNKRSGIVDDNQHKKFGTCGPKQITITYKDSTLDPRLVDSTGKKLLIMAKQNTSISLLPRS